MEYKNVSHGYHLPGIWQQALALPSTCREKIWLTTHCKNLALNTSKSAFRSRLHQQTLRCEKSLRICGGCLLTIVPHMQLSISLFVISFPSSIVRFDTTSSIACLQLNVNGVTSSSWTSCRLDIFSTHTRECIFVSVSSQNAHNEILKYMSTWFELFLPAWSNGANTRQPYFFV